MKESSEIEQTNYGPAAVTLVAEEKGIEVSFGIIMTGKDVQTEPLQISQVEENFCSFDEETGKATRMVEGKLIEASGSIMKKARDARIKQGRKIRKVKPKNDDIEK